MQEGIKDVTKNADVLNVHGVAFIEGPLSF